MMRENMDKLAEVLKEYELKAEYAESVTDKLTKVYASSGASYALKKMSSNRNGQFIETLHGAHQKGYSGYVPIFRNRHRQFFTSDGENWYYIMPWLTNETEEERDERHKNMFRELAALHQRTAAEEKLNQNALKIHYDTLAKQWDDNKAQYEKYVEECEKKWYLSPFELQAGRTIVPQSLAQSNGFAYLKESDGWALSKLDEVRLIAFDDSFVNQPSGSSLINHI